MRERKLPCVGRKIAYDRGAVPRSGRLCTQCGELPVERHVLLVLAGERFNLRLCTHCAGKALGWSAGFILAAMAEYDDDREYDMARVADLLGHPSMVYHTPELLAP
jgi:hypothetical protein